MYKSVKKKLQEAGEVMVKMADGAVFELHLHNAEFNDADSTIYVDGSEEKYWLNGNEITYYWIHKEAKSE